MVKVSSSGRAYSFKLFICALIQKFKIRNKGETKIVLDSMFQSSGSEDIFSVFHMKTCFLLK